MKAFAPEVIDALSTAARSVALEPALLLALVSVETSGEPFERDGTPTILCEPAVFYKECPAGLQSQALSAGIAARSWSRDGYKDQGTAVGRAARFARMCAVDENAAYRSVSMGLGQIMGFNCGHAGFGCARDMYEAFRDVAVQAKAIVAVLPALGVLEPLKAHDWVKVATRYNGPGERHNRYDARLADSYAHWEFALASGQTAAPHDGIGLWSPHGDEVRALQEHLTTLGFATKADGWFGPKTAEAVARFEVRKGLPDTGGVATQAVLDAIANALPVPQGARDVIDAGDLKATSRIVQGTAKLKAVAVGTVGTGVTAALADPVASANSAMDKADQAKAMASRATTMVGGAEHAQTLLTWLAAHPLPLVGTVMAIIGGVAWWLSHGVEQARVDDARTGATP